MLNTSLFTAKINVGNNNFVDPPEIEVERVWVHSGEGNEALLVCIVNAEPHAEVNIIYIHI